MTAPDRVAGSPLPMLGLLTLGIGIYLVHIRPPLLPEDIVFTGLAPDALPPAFRDWLRLSSTSSAGVTLGV